MMTRYYTLLIAALILLSGCVGQRRYRYLRTQPECFDGNRDPFTPSSTENRDWSSLDCRNKYYKVGFAEFNDKGDPVDTKQLEKIEALIRFEKARAARENGTNKIITLIYVHGWKNNAEQAVPGGKQKDVERFSLAMSELGYRAKRVAGKDKEPVPIVGIYIGWRGRSLNGPGWFTFLSYWGRRNAANRVGGPPLAKALNSFIDLTNDQSPASRVLLVGHSFGARVVDHAIADGKVKLYDTPAAGQLSRPRIDLALLVNSANDARLSMSMIRQLSSDGIQLQHPDADPRACAQKPNQRQCRYPLVAAITSTGDTDTKFLLPAANFINLDKDPAHEVPPITEGKFLDPIPPAGIYKRAAAGHLRFLHTHDVNPIACSAAPPQCGLSGGSDDADCEFAFRTEGESPACYQVNVRPENRFNKTPFWVMSVDPTIIRNHGDIWNLSFVSMLGAMIGPRGFFELDTKPVQVRK
jgi:pimeloyl-ACP methyl ester carboxylesterase